MGQSNIAHMRSHAHAMRALQVVKTLYSTLAPPVLQIVYMQAGR